ncbi:MAG: hypothetical protein WC401_12475 [Bacteroidales bacterium]|jgi:hypothetical protein
MQHEFNPVIMDVGRELSYSEITLLDENAGRIAAELAGEWAKQGSTIPTIQISEQAYSLSYDLLLARQKWLSEIDKKQADGLL